MENLFDKSATWTCLIWEKSMKWIHWKMEGRNVLSQTNSTSHWMPLLSCAQLGEYTYKNISCKVEKYNSTFDFHHPFYFFLFCLFGLLCYIQGYTRKDCPKELSYALSYYSRVWNKCRGTFINFWKNLEDCFFEKWPQCLDWCKNELTFWCQTF